MTEGVLCRLADVIRAEIELLDLDLDVQSAQVTPQQPHSVSENRFLAEPSHPGRESRPQIPVASLPSIMTKLFPGRKYFQAASTAARGSGITE